MKRNLLKRIGAVALAVAVSLTMGTAAFAADATDPATLNGGIANSSSTTLVIPKGVTFMNDDAVMSYGPGITYSYTVAPATVDSGTTITDHDGTTGTLNAGPDGGMTIDSTTPVSFASTDTFTTTAAGTEATKNIVLNVDLSKFSKPGIYRYVLTDTTTTDALSAAGITRDANYQKTRYIDVFIKQGTSALEVYGYAVKATNNATDNEGQANTTGKDPGFVASSSAEGSKTDKYKTYNVTLTKAVAGAMADKNHEFPFAATISNGSKTYFAVKGGISDITSTTATAATSLSTSLKDGETYTIAGLSPLATVAYEETNDTTDLYTVTVAGSDSAALEVTQTDNKYSVAAGNVSDYDGTKVGAATKYSAVTYTNTLNEVSPTNVVMRFAPFLFIFGAAILLLVVMRRRRTQDAE